MFQFVRRLLKQKPAPQQERWLAEPLEQRLLLTRLAVFGDYSIDNAVAPTRDVSNLITNWNPDAVITAGDNNYPHGEASTIDANIGQWYHQFISPYTGSYGAGSADGQNHFWPALGNHDYDTNNGQAYFNYFTLPNNERYYDVTIGNIEVFIVDSEPNDPDGNTAASTQANWIKSQMLASTAPWKIVVFHEPYYSSGPATNVNMNWPFASWGATAVITGHDHQYERLSENGIPYFVDGLGGDSIFDFSTTVPGSQVRYNSDYGAMRIDSTNSSITFSFITRTGLTIDTYTIGTSVPNPPTNLQAAASPGQIALSWGAATGATSYNVYRGTSSGGESTTPIATNLTGTTFTDTNVTNGPTYYYEVTAVNGAGESDVSVEASASLAPPATPLIQLVNGGINQIALSWGATAGAASFSIYRGTSPGGESTTPYATNITTTSFTDTGLSQGATFYYEISAVNGLGESAKSPEVSATVVVAPSHVVVVIESHFSVTGIIGNANAPYINSLAQQGAYFPNATGVTYPGQPNYLALFSGSTQNVTSDTVPAHQFTKANLGSELIAAGLTFTGYAQGLPSAGSLTNSSGAYVRYHNPWSEFSNVPSADNQPFTAFPSDFASLPTVSFVVPDLNNDMHDGTITQADTWLQTNLGAYATWATTHNSLLVLTWDDNDSGSDPANHIATIIYGQQVQAGDYDDTDTISHYGTLRTIEDLYGVTRLGSAASAAPIQDAWLAAPMTPPVPMALQATTGGTQQISLTWTASAGASGYNVYRGTTPGGENATPIASNVSTASFNDSGLTPGITYYYQVTALNNGGESAPSTEASATTQKATPAFSGLSASSAITYGTASVALAGTISAGALIPSGNVTITINGSPTNAPINASTGAFSVNFDTHAVPASATACTITYSFASNASFNSASDTGKTLTVNQRTLHVSAAGTNRIYDGTTADVVTLSDDRINNDVFTDSDTSATFADKNVGTSKTVSVSGIGISGAAAGNYVLAATTASTTANITARTLTVTAAGINKIYDATTAATVTLSDNRVAGDTLSETYAAALFSDKNVGTTKSISVSGISLSGTDAGNYTFNTTASVTADITPELSIAGTSAADSITLMQDSDQQHIDWFLNGTSLGQLAITDLSGLTITGGGGIDVIALDNTNGNPLPSTLHLSGTFTINGFSPSNPLANTNLEIGRSTLFISYRSFDPLSLFQGYLRNGYNNGGWNGTPTAQTGVITSAPAAQNGAQTTGIGYADSADGLIAGQPANTIELKYTLYGDTNLTGSVGFNDFTRLTQHFGQTAGGTWDIGDFNYDGSVNNADYILLARTYNTSLGSQAVPAAQPASSSASSPAVASPSPAPAPNAHKQPHHPQSKPALIKRRR